MKRLTGIAVFLFFAFALCAINITIGGSGSYNGPNESPCPYGNTYRNERVQYIIAASELQAAGGGAGPINSVSLNIAALNNVGPLSNYRIKIGATIRDAWSASDKAFVQGLTEVWRASVYQPSLGINVHYFNQPFVWDGVSNIVLDMGYSLTSYYAPKTANPGTMWTWSWACRSAYMISDAMNACEEQVAYSVSNYRADLTFNMGALNPTVPNTVVPLFPGNGATNIDVPTTISWLSGGGNPSGYKLFLGTDTPPPLLADLQQDSTWTASLAYSTTYYWQVVPYNSLGDAVDCPIWSFTTDADPVVHSFPWQTDFGSVTGAPFPPHNWSKYGGLLADSTSLGSPGSGFWAMGNWLNQSATNKAALCPLQNSKNGWLITPWLHIPTENYELSFDLGMVTMYSQYPPEQTGTDDVFAVLASPDSTWGTPDLLRKWDNAGSDYVLNSIGNQGTNITIPLGAPGTKRIAFYAGSQYMNAANQVFIDNIIVRLNPGLPVLNVNPSRLDFGLGLQYSSNPIMELSIYNSGLDTLQVNIGDISIIGEAPECFSFDTSVLPFALTAGQSAVLPVYFNPTSMGSKTATLRIVNNQCRQNFDVPLSGEALSHPSVAIGHGSENLNNIPIEANKGFSYSQTLMLQSEINISGSQIEKLWLYWNSYFEGSRSHEWCIYLGHTAKTSFTDGDDWIPAAGLTKVFEGWVELPAASGWICIELDTPFIYNNSSNLVIATEENESLYLGFAVGFRGSSVGSARSIAYGSSCYNPGPWGPYTGTLYNQIPNLILSFATASPEPKLQVSRNEVDFNAQESGDINGPLKLISVRNVGGGTLIFDSSQLLLQGPDADQFVIMGDGISHLQNGQYATFLIRFIPQSAGHKTASLVIQGDASPDTLQLHGLGYLPGSFHENFEGDLFPPEGWVRSDQQWNQSAYCTYIPELIIAGEHSAISLMNSSYPASHLITPAIRLVEGSKTISYSLKGFNNNFWYGASCLKLFYRTASDPEWVQLADSLWFYYDERQRFVCQDISSLEPDVYQFRFTVSSSFWYGNEGNVAVVVLDEVRCTGTLATPFIELDRSNAFLERGSENTVQLEVTAWGAWTATSSASWLHLSAAYGNNSSNLSISADTNPMLSSRTATITFSNGISPNQVCNVVQSGLRGNALAFDGYDDYVITQHPAGAIGNAISISTWLKWEPSAPNEIDFICGNLMEQLEIHTGATDNNLRFIPTDGVYLDAGPVLPVNEWAHILCSYSVNPPEAHIWVNGVEQSISNNGHNPVGTAFAANLGSFYLGRRGDSTYYFRGCLDEFSLWDRVLDSAQIQSLISAPPLLESNGLLQYFSFNHGIPGESNPGITLLTDHKSAMNGTLNNFSLQGSVSNWVNSGAMMPVFLATPELNISSDAVLSWNPVPGADFYRIYYSSTIDGPYEALANTYNTCWQVDNSILDRAFFKVKAIANEGMRRY